MSLKKAETNAPKAEAADGVGGLLAAIRGAGVGGLKKVTAEDRERKDAAPTDAGLAGIGLALAAALDNRRKDIDNDSDAEDEDDDDWDDDEDDED